MGNYKFKLSDMMPNSWFYKLRDMGKATRNPISFPKSSTKRSHSPRRTTTTPNPLPPPKLSYLPNRPSYYFPSRENQKQQQTEKPTTPKSSDTQFPLDPPRKSKKNTRKKPIRPPPNLLSSSVSCRTTPSSLWKSNIPPVNDSDDQLDGINSCSSSPADIIIDMKKKPNKAEEFVEFIALSERHLPPILTKPVKTESEEAKLDGRNLNLRQQTMRGIKVRQNSNSPRFGSKRARPKGVMQQRKWLTESFMVAKSSADPKKDFRESMVEMIIENDIRASKDLEELLACYLSLNSIEYHDVIVKVFQQIWFDLTDDVRL